MPKGAVGRQAATLIASVDELQAALRHYRRGFGKFASLVEKGAPVAEALGVMEGTAYAKPRLVPDALDEFEAARSAFRTAIVNLARDEGMSASELARRLGVSRQLMSRIALTD